MNIRQMTLNAPNIESALKSLRVKLDDAIWNDDAEQAQAIRAEIDRLELLASYGETHDLPF